MSYDNLEEELDMFLEEITEDDLSMFTEEELHILAEAAMTPTTKKAMKLGYKMGRRHLQPGRGNPSKPSVDSRDSLARSAGSVMAKGERGTKSAYNKGFEKGKDSYRRDRSAAGDSSFHAKLDAKGPEAVKKYIANRITKRNPAGPVGKLPEETTSIVDIYAKIISEQARKQGGFIVESEAKAAKAYASHEKLSKKGHDDLPLKHGDGFYHKNSDMADQTYIIKHKSGKHSMTDISHDMDKNKADYEKQSREQNPHLSDAEHKEVAELVHKNHNS